MPDYYADPVAEQLNKVGPRGWEHGWRFVGIPGGAAHANAVRDLAGRVNDPDTRDSLNRAADAIDRGDYSAARDHIADAHTNLLASHGNLEDAAAIDASARPLEQLRGTRAEVHDPTPLSPAYHYGTTVPLAKPPPLREAEMGTHAYAGAPETISSTAFASSPSEADLAGRWQTTPSGEAYTIVNGRMVNMYGQPIAAGKFEHAMNSDPVIDRLNLALAHEQPTTR